MHHQKFKYFFILFVFIFMLLSVFISHKKTHPTITTTAKIATAGDPDPFSDPDIIIRPENSTAVETNDTGPVDPDPISGSDLKIRPGYPTYESYIHHQLNKTLNPKLRHIWMTRDWTRKIRVFTLFFNEFKKKGLLSNSSKALSVGARMGQEVEALKRVGVSDSIGMDLVPHPPLVMRGDFHQQPFDDETFDFEFSNVFDHALYPSKFVGEIERTLRPGGVCVLHVAIRIKSDKYSANDLLSIDPLKKMFKKSKLVHVRTVDGFGLDTEVVFKKLG